MAYRILSLSGGGMRGIFQAVCLRELAASLPQPLSANFELVAGTSTGAIIALGVGLQIDPARIVDLFRRHGEGIFARRLLGRLRKGPRYSPDLLRQVLTGVFQNRQLKDCKTNMIISATTMDTFKTRVFSTWNERDRDLSVVDVIMASCAAPTFFPPVKPAGEERDYVDGGLWGNCPCLVAVTEARANKQAELEEIQMLEIGNGRFSQGALGSEFTRLRPISPKMINAVFEMMFAAQHAMAEDVLEKLGMDDKRILVLDTQTKEAIELDDVQRAVAVLPALAEEEVRKRSTEVKRFLGV